MGCTVQAIQVERVLCPAMLETGQQRFCHLQPIQNARTGLTTDT